MKIQRFLSEEALYFLGVLLRKYFFLVSDIDFYTHDFVLRKIVDNDCINAK